MITFICLFLPAVLSVWIYEGLTKQDLSVKRWVSFYGVNVLFINFFCLMMMRLVLDQAGTYLYNRETDIEPYVATNYLILAIPAAVVLGVVFALLHKNVKIELEARDDAKE